MLKHGVTNLDFFWNFMWNGPFVFHFQNKNEIKLKTIEMKSKLK